jgi:hypothetical protein
MVEKSIFDLNDANLMRFLAQIASPHKRVRDFDAHQQQQGKRLGPFFVDRFCVDVE